MKASLRYKQFMSVDPYNNPFPRAASGAICGGFRAVLFGLNGDQKYIQRALKLTTSWVSEKCCMYCDAALSGPHLYTFFGENAPHRSTLKSTTDFIVHGCRPNPWIRIPGFDISIVMTDWLHLVDLAITPEMAGSVNCLCISSFTCGLHQQVLLKWSSWFTGKVVFDVWIPGFGWAHQDGWCVERGFSGRTASTRRCWFCSWVQKTSY